MNKNNSPMSLVAANLESYPAIWDNSHCEYHNFTTRANQFEQLAKVAGLANGTDTKTKYESLRTKFRRVSTNTHLTIL